MYVPSGFIRPTLTNLDDKQQFVCTLDVVEKRSVRYLRELEFYFKRITI